MSQMLPPGLPLSKKRKMSQSSVSSTKSDDFSTGVKSEARLLLGGEQCWLCDSGPLIEYCHLFAKEDKIMRSHWEVRGLLNFTINGLDNVIILCPTCHSHFDTMNDPGWFLVPVDLEYFIEYERSDYDFRLQEARRGIRRTRDCPTAEKYATALRRSNAIPADFSQGLYRRIFLRNFHPHIPPGTLPAVKAWFGAPMAALRRACHATSSFRSGAIPQQMLAQLRTLLDLYCRPDPVISAAPSLAPTSIAMVKSDINPHLFPSTDQPRLFQENAATSGSATSHLHQFPQSNYHQARSPWILGPQMTTEEVIYRYRPVFLGD